MKLLYKGINIFYKDQGKGKCILLLHGFLEDQSIWDTLCLDLVKSTRVIRVDLLGHGKTGNTGYIHTMKDMAEAVFAVVDHLEIDQYVLIGHSMGGYVALELATLNRKALLGFCLMNSTYKADSKERKQLRKRANKMAKENFAGLIRMSFLNLFSEESRAKYPEEIEKGMSVALKTSVQGYLAAQEGMIKRKNLVEVFKVLKVPKLILLGKKDGLIDHRLMVKELVDVTVEITLLSEGHMSHIENKEEYTYKIKRFIEKL